MPGGCRCGLPTKTRTHRHRCGLPCSGCNGGTRGGRCRLSATRGIGGDLPLVWTSLLVGAIPRQGKTFATRLAAAGLILDPYARLYVFDGKGGKDWEAAEQIAYRFVCGDELPNAEAVRDHLVELVAEVQSR